MSAHIKFGFQVLLLLLIPASVGARSHYQEVRKQSTKDYPKTIRGYKVAKASVVVTKPAPSAVTGDSSAGTDSDDAIVQLGDFSVARITPLGITLELPVTVSAVKQGGHVDFLTFEDVIVNGTEVAIDDYYHQFELPTKEISTLPAPIRVYISLPGVVMGAIDEWSDSKESWRVSARVYVFGRYRKFLMKFKRVVPVELDLEIPNPLRRGEKLSRLCQQEPTCPAGDHSKSTARGRRYSRHKFGRAFHYEVRLGIRTKLENVRAGFEKAPFAIESLGPFIVLPDAQPDRIERFPLTSFNHILH
jgi:hypothetical protein